MNKWQKTVFKFSILAVLAVINVGLAFAAPLSIDITSAQQNPPSPQMGDRLRFHTSIKNTSAEPVRGVIGWISLVRIDKGNEAPVDLEDWSAHKAITKKILAPGATIETDWPMRLIQAGKYRVIISAVTTNSKELTASPPVDFTIRVKPVVQSARVLPIAFGIPFVLGGFMVWRWRKS